MKPQVCSRYLPFFLLGNLKSVLGSFSSLRQPLVCSRHIFISYETLSQSRYLFFSYETSSLFSWYFFISTELQVCSSYLFISLETLKSVHGTFSALRKPQVCSRSVWKTDFSGTFSMASCLSGKAQTVYGWLLQNRTKIWRARPNLGLLFTYFC